MFEFGLGAPTRLVKLPEVFLCAYVHAHFLFCHGSFYPVAGLDDGHPLGVLWQIEHLFCRKIFYRESEFKPIFVEINSFIFFSILVEFHLLGNQRISALIKVNKLRDTEHNHQNECAHCRKEAKLSADFSLAFEGKSGNSDRKKIVV